MNLDDAMIAKLLGTYGAPNTANNAQRARDFFASNPDIAERRAMGVRGAGLDDNSDVFGAQLEKFIAKTDLPPRNAAETYSPPAQESNPVIAQGTKPKPAGSPSRQGNYGPATDTATKQGKDYGPGTEGGKGGDWWPWLLAGLGLTATKQGGVGGAAAPNAPKSGLPAPVVPPEAGYVGPMRNVNRETDPRLAGYIKGPNGEPPAAAGDPRLPNPYNRNQVGYEPKLEDNISDLSRVKTNEPPPTTVTGDPGLEAEAKKRQLQAEIDAENKQAMLLQEQIKRQHMQRANTQSLSDAAKRAVGRK